MIRNIVTVLMCLCLTSCITAPAPDPVFVSQIDAGFNKRNAHTYTGTGAFKQPIPYKVGQYVVTGMTSDSERSISKIAIVGKEQGGWIIESHALTPSSKSITQMLVLGMDSVYKTGTIDALDIVWVKIKPDGQSMQIFDGPMLTLTKGMYKKSLAGLEMQPTTQKGSETVEVPAGNFKGAMKAGSEVSFLGKKYSSDVWLHPSVPINGMVKSVSDSDKITIELLDFGLSGAKKSF